MTQHLKDTKELNQFFGLPPYKGFSGTSSFDLSGSVKLVPRMRAIKTSWQPSEPTIRPLSLPNESVGYFSEEQQKQIDALVRDYKESMNRTPPISEAKEAVRFDTGKTQWDLMPFEAIEEINKVLEFGAKKYAAHNWQKGEGFKYSRVLNSLLRHIFAYMRGEDNDPESGLSHLAHAGCNIVFLLYYVKNKSRYKNDDRHIV